MRRARSACGRLALLTLLTLLLAGCGGGGLRPGATTAGHDAQARERSQAFIDAGNQAYQAGDYPLALKRYAAAAVADPQDPAAYFGMGMTFTRLKREDEARAAFARARALAEEARRR